MREVHMASSNVTQLQKDDGKVGGGTEATSGKQVTVHYTGWLYDSGRGDHKGRKFDSSRTTSRSKVKSQRSKVRRTASRSKVKGQTHSVKVKSQRSKVRSGRT